MDRTILLRTIEEEYTHLEALIAPLSEKQLCASVSEGEWSIKDILVHVAVWEQICARWLEEFLRGETPQPSERLDRDANDRIYRENRDRNMSEVWELMRNAHEYFLHQVDLLTQTYPEEDWNAAHRYAWTESWPGYSLLSAIADNSYEHYQDHVQHIRSMLDAERSR